MAEKPRIRVPSSVKAGEVFEVKTLISHPMESGLRKGPTGQPYPRRILNKFTCKANGREVFSVDMFPSTAADPFITFKLRLSEASKLEFSWQDDDGSIISETVSVQVG